jgi:hypothetical protein
MAALEIQRDRPHQQLATRGKDVFSFLAKLFKATTPEPIIIVSGLPRSGTSMMMKMLEAGGLSIMTDAIRTADEDNPKGYYEFERVKELEKETDKGWLQQGRGKVLKVISFLLKDLPAENTYQVIFLHRDLDEVLASQAKMHTRRGEENSVDDDAMRGIYENHLRSVLALMKVKKNMTCLEVSHAGTIAEPSATAAAVSSFLGGALDATAMASVVDKNLHRNRKENLSQSA